MTRSFEKWCQLLQSQKSGMDLSLNRVKAVASHLDLLSPLCPVITVSGTNGKGSTILALEHLYHQAHYNTLSFMSPCITSFCEQFSINQCPATEQQLISTWQEIYPYTTQTPLTLFEYKALTALQLAKQHQPDVLLLEVGLGGQDDATNIIDCDVAILTQVGHDHAHILGKTKQQRGRIKAGIFRPNKPAIVTEQTPPQSVIDYADTIGAKLQIYPGPTTSHHPILSPGIQWAVQMAVKSLSPQLPISVDQPDFNTLALPYRFQQQQYQGKTLIYDTAHNEGAAHYLKQLIESHLPNTPIDAIFSCFDDKEPHKIINVLREKISTWHIAPLQHPRACAIQAIEAALKQNNLSYYIHPSIQQAKQSFLNKDRDTALIFGSHQTIKESLEKS